MKQKNRLWRKDKLVLSDICHLLSILLSNCPPTDVNGKIYLLWPLHRCWQHIGAVQWRTKHVSWMGVSTNTSRYLHFGLYLFNLKPFWDVQVSLFQTLFCLNIGKKKGAQNKEDKTQPGVTFCETSPLSNGDKNMGYWRKPVGEKQGWGEPNYNGL